MDEQMVMVKELVTTERGAKGIGSSDTRMNKQVGTGANLLTKSPHQNWHGTSLSEPGESMKKKGCQETPRPRTMTQQVHTGANLLTKHSWEITGRLDQPNCHNQALSKKIHISAITQKEFRQAYRNGEATGIVKFSQKEKQIYLQKINISTELAIRNKEELGTRTKTGEDSLENLVPGEYHDLLQAFEKGDKTSLPPHRPGIDLEINMEEGKGVPEQKIYPLGAEELETVQEYINKNEARGWIREAFTDEGSPIMFVKKNEGSLRLCVDYRALNEVTKKDRYPLPLIGEALDRLHTAKYFTKLDIKEGYHNVRIKKGDEWKTTFTSKY